MQHPQNRRAELPSDAFSHSPRQPSCVAAIPPILGCQRETNESISAGQSLRCGSFGAYFGVANFKQAGDLASLQSINHG